MAGIGDFIFGVDEPAEPSARNYAQETRDTLQAQVDLAPEQYAASAKYDPLYAQLKTKTLQSMLQGGTDGPGIISTYDELLGPWSQRVTRDANRATRLADVQDVQALGGQMVDAIDSADPTSAAMRKSLTSDVFSELMAGDHLTPAERRSVEQASRSSAAARGMGSSQSSALDEAVQLALTGQNLKSQRQQKAASVLALNKSLVGDPMLMVTGRSSGSTGVGANLLGMGLGTQTGAQQFNGESGYASDVYNTNYNAGWSNLLNARNANAAYGTAGLGLFGSGLGVLGNIGAANVMASGSIWGN